MEQIYDLIIVGNGFEGLAAGIYAAEQNLEFIIIGNGEDQTVERNAEISDYPGFPSITSGELYDMFYEHAEALGITVLPEAVTGFELDDPIKTIITPSGEYSSLGIILTSLSGELAALFSSSNDRFETAEDTRTSINMVYAAGNARNHPFNKIVTFAADAASAVNSFSDDIK